MRYVLAKAEMEAEAETYRIYISEAIKAINNNVIRVNGGIELTASYTDFIDRYKSTNEPTDEEVRDKITTYLGLIAEMD